MRKQSLDVILIALSASIYGQADEGKLSDRVQCKYRISEIDIAALKSRILAEESIPVLTEDKGEVQFMTSPNQPNPVVTIGYRLNAEENARTPFKWHKQCSHLNCFFNLY